MEEKTLGTEISLGDIQADGQQKAQELDKLAFPLYVFPKPIKELIEEAHKIVGFPKDYFAGGILAALSVAIGNSCKLRVRYTQKEAPVFFIALVGAKGINKTHPIKFAFQPIRDIEKALSEQYLKDKEQYEFELTQYQSANKKERSLLNLPKKPKLVQYIFKDVTTEALIEGHSDNKRGICYFRDELEAWLSDMNKYRQGSDMSFWLTAFSCQPIKYNRKTGDVKFLNISEPFISVVGTMQPGILFKIFSGNKLDNGFSDRIFFIYPQRLKKPEIFNSGNIPEYLVGEYRRIISQLMALHYDENNTSVLELSEEALNVYSAWYKEKAKLYNTLSDTDYKKGVISKAEIYVMRFALLLQLIYHECFPNKYSNNQIEEEIINYAITLGEYYIDMSVFVWGYISSSEKNDENRIIANYLKKQGLSNRQIAEKLNTSHTTVNNWFKK